MTELLFVVNCLLNCWQVYRVPETATVLLGGGVNFAELPEYAQIEFQVPVYYHQLLQRC